MPQGFSYSKWDKLELSDDEDFECHPNVDKASMIRWKQADIHMKRRDRQDRIKALKMESDMNSRIAEGLAGLVSEAHNQKQQQDSPASENVNNSADGALGLAGAVEKLGKSMMEWDETLAKDVMMQAFKDRDPRWADPTPDPFFMKRINMKSAVDSLEAAVKKDESGSAAIVVAAHLRQTLLDRNRDLAAEIKKGEDEINAKLTSETISTGFNKTIVSTPKSMEPEPVPEAKKKSVKTKESTIITLNSPSNLDATEEAKAATSAEPQDNQQPQQSIADTESSDEEDEEVYITHPRVKEFSELTKTEDSFKFISEHPFIMNKAQKYDDQVLAEGFSLEMKGESKKARNCVHQALMIQYCQVLGPDGVNLFFQRLANPSHKARETFLKDVADTYKRIADRVKVLKQEEKEKEMEEKRQGEARVAAALQEDGTYKLPAETEEEKERAKVFDSLPQALQVALLKQDVDEINEFLATATKSEAEKYLKEASSVGLLSLADEVEEEIAK